MPSTYTPISTTLLSTSSASVTFSSIPQTYTDLVLITDCIGDNASYPQIRLNSDTGTNYSYTSLRGQSGSVTASRGSNQSWLYITGSGVYSTNSYQLGNIVFFNNYSSTTQYKTALARDNSYQGTPSIDYVCVTWRNNSAISTINIVPGNGNFSAGSMFTLYGIKAA